MFESYNENEREEILNKVEKRGNEIEMKCFGCGQATMLALQEVFQMKNEELFKALSGFGYGIGRMRLVCGSLIAGDLFLGLKYGRNYGDLDLPVDVHVEKMRASYEPVGRLHKWFEREFGSVICREIRKSFLGVDLDPNIQWQLEMAREEGIHDYCSRLVGKVARKTGELLISFR